MKALIDRHHADLFHSLQLLFEDRLGIEVWTPVGHEWWDEGYWRFGEGYGDDRLARQFLTTDGWVRAGALLTEDTHHPGRPIRGIHLEEARNARWDYVVATVQDNQRGFRRLADDLGARYVLQVGNTRSQVDWELDPLALVSSEVSIEGRGVRYHQLLPAAFTYQAPTTTLAVRSYVNCFGSTPCAQLLDDARPILRGPVWVHGIDGPDGNAETVSDIAEGMARSAWGWHDKVQGDGFGHVLHDWAAIGRPLIGHGSHYAGLMGERFWQDGTTCLDLDKRSIRDVAEMVNTISPADHERMCRAIRAEFDAIDYEAEIEQIGRFLGCAS